MVDKRKGPMSKDTGPTLGQGVGMKPPHRFRPSPKRLLARREEREKLAVLPPAVSILADIIVYVDEVL